MGKQSMPLDRDGVALEVYGKPYAELDEGLQGAVDYEREGRLEEAARAERGFSYQPPIESTCCHGKTIGPCAYCAANEVRERRELRP